MIADMMNLQARNELLKERINLLEKAVEEALTFDDRKNKHINYSFDKNKVFDVLQEALSREKEIKI